MDIIIDHKLRIALSELPTDALHHIQEALSIRNLERERAEKQGIWGWQSWPETIQLYALEENHFTTTLVMPRGFLMSLCNGLKALGISYQIVDERMGDEVIVPMGDKIDLHPWQMPAVEAIFIYGQGIWKAPAGSGKTVGVLEAIRRSKCPSIVIVNTQDILHQWVNRAKQFLGNDFPVGMIGAGYFQISDYLTIATAQTLHRRFDRLEEIGFFDQFSFLCLDECHHATATTYRRLIDRFPCRYRIGVSATPDKTGDFALAQAVLGPIFHVTDPADVDSIIKPVVFRIPTKFRFNYVPKRGNKPSNYPELLDSLVHDEARNDLIVKSIMINKHGHSLVVSKRIEHLEILRTKLARAGYPYHIYYLTGDTATGIRKLIVENANKPKPCIIFSTLADEALDIPRLDKLFLVYPQRNAGLILQQCGRIARVHPEKKYADVFDFADPLVGPCEQQWKIRRNQVYDANGYEIQHVLASEVMEFEISNTNNWRLTEDIVAFIRNGSL